MTKANFKELYNQLNAGQKQAVDAIDGPVMVVAGPGTGKTQILAARIANIRELTDTNPSQILCLTYTEAGVVAMRERLLKFIGPDAYRVNIHTFHSLCNEIIQFNSGYFGYKNLKAADDLETYKIIREMIDEIPANSKLKRVKGEVYYDADNFKFLFDVIKKEHLNIESMKLHADAYLINKELEEAFVYKRASGKFKKGDRKEKEYKDEVLKIERFKEALDQFEVFNRKMEERRLYDFSDMILWVLKAFKEDKDFLLDFQEKYLYFLVDEFQDTNGAQLELVQYLTEYWESPNLFVVGDEDQSIYRFQGANIHNIHNFEKSFASNLKTTVLTENYRSSQPILDASGALIKQNIDRLSHINKELVAKHLEYSRVTEEPKIYNYFNPIHETVAVGKAIRELHEQGVAYNEIAVLYVKHKHVDDLIKYFDIYDVPYNSKKKVNILKELLIKKFMTILKYINAERLKPYSGEAYIFEILNYDFYDIHPLDLAKISAEIKNKKWRDYLSDKIGGQQDLFSSQSGHGSKVEIKRLSADLEFWIKESVNVTVPQLIEFLIAKGGILSYVMKADDKRWQMQMLRTFFDFVKDEAAKNPDMTLQDFIEVVDTYNTFELSIDATQVLHVPDSVNLMTLHGSKGLEFEHVFIIRCIDSEWMKKTGGSRDFGLSKYMNNAKEEIEIEEMRRLMYVGMTRAKRGLYLTFYRNDLKGKEVSKLQFIAELESLTGLRESSPEIDEKDILEFEQLYYRFDSVPDFELLDHDYLDVLLENYTLSATHLNSYLKCPISFYFSHVLKVPSAKSESASFGTAIHKAMEELFRKYTDTKVLPSVDEYIGFFNTEMRSNRDSFTKQSLKRYQDHGKDILEKYYNHYKDEWLKEEVYVVEKNMTHIEIGGIPVKGKLDKILFNGNEAYVIDFKTGDYEKALKKCKEPGSTTKIGSYEDEYGGDYWRQMVFYHLLIANYTEKKWEMLRGEMDFVEPDKHGKFHKAEFFIKPEDAEIVKNQIKDTYLRIKAHDFEEGCGDEYCHWCNFVKYYLKKETHITDNLPGSKVDEEEGML